jgi:hypothetical protein
MTTTITIITTIRDSSSTRAAGLQPYINFERI